MQQTVYTLLCKRDLAMGLVTIPKILKFLQVGQKLVVIDDGSFDEETIGTISALAPNIEVLTRSKREERVLKLLGNRPNCIKYRNDFPFAFKLIDIPLIAAEDSPRYTYTDGDIIYLKDCEDYFNRDVNTYLRTDAIKLSFKLQHGLLKYKWKIPMRFNAGYLCYDTKDYDLDFVEKYLGMPDVRHMPWVSEQSCWALIFGRAGKSLCPKENEFVCRENFTGPQPDTLAIHLIGNLKNRLNEWADEKDANKTGTLKPGFEPSRNITVLDWVQKSAHRFSPFK